MEGVVSILVGHESSTSARTDLGQAGERLAADLLIKKGYRIVVTNFKTPIGRNSKGVQITGEIDIIALDEETLCFVEVKTRRSADFTPIITAVDRRKQRQIARTARHYRRVFGLTDIPIRYDAVTVLMPTAGEPEVVMVRGLWNEAVLKRKVWRDMEFM